MDTIGLIAPGTAASGGGVTRAIWPFLVRDLWSDRGRHRVSGPGEGCKIVFKRPLAHVSSPRDNCLYRAAFSPRNHHEIAPPETALATAANNPRNDRHGRAGRLETIPCRR